jgi:hypothetical protein
MFDSYVIVNEAEVKRRLGLLANQSGKVISRAANRATATGKKAIAQETAKKYLVTQKDVNATLSLKRATYANPAAVFRYRGQHRNLYHYKGAVTPSTIISWRGGSPNVRIYRARVRRDQSAKPMNKRPKDFVQTMTGTNGQVIMVHRATNASRSKLVATQGPAIPQIAKNEEVLARFQRDAGKMLVKRLDHEIQRVLEGH